MRRLTERTNKGFSHLVGKDVCYSHISYDCPRIEGLHLLDKALKKLAEYEDLEENGLLVRLPCKIGSKVYSAKEEYTVTEIRCFDDFEPEFIAENDYSDICFESKDIGKTVFLTQAEAEEKLKEMEGENGD